jgi:hypothetical protein
MSLSSTKIGVIRENLLVNAVDEGKQSRLSPFQPLADSDGLDCLFYDKETGAVQNVPTAAPRLIYLHSESRLLQSKSGQERIDLPLKARPLIIHQRHTPSALQIGNDN